MFEIFDPPKRMNGGVGNVEGKCVNSFPLIISTYESFINIQY